MDAQLEALAQSTWFLPVLVILSLWDLIWRGLALWRAAGEKSVPWFIALMVFNTVGILPIIYLAFFSKEK